MIAIFGACALRRSLAVSLAGCSAGMPSLPSIKNPFAKKEEMLPGERIAVITDQSLEAPDPALAAKPIALASGRGQCVVVRAWRHVPPTVSAISPRRSGEQSPGGWISAPALRPADASARSRSSPTARCSRSMPAAPCRPFPLRAAVKGLVDERDAEEREAGGRLRRRARARQRAALRHHRIWHRGRHRSRQGQRAVDAEDRRAGALVAHCGRRQGLFRIDRQRVALSRRQ